MQLGVHPHRSRLPMFTYATVAVAIVGVAATLPHGQSTLHTCKTISYYDANSTPTDTHTRTHTQYQRTSCQIAMCNLMQFNPFRYYLSICLCSVPSYDDSNGGGQDVDVAPGTHNEPFALTGCINALTPFICNITRSLSLRQNQTSISFPEKNKIIHYHCRYLILKANQTHFHFEIFIPI